ncbi:MAG: TatD family hydrolase [Candidatus Aenigmarchaeota archaeon]|nr:TatD family hydrolase [Candidatus Aenigmarchaeota archaeon]
MIDVHCHLEQPDYDKDRDEVIKNCKQELKAVVTCAAHPKNFDPTMSLVEKYKSFVFATVSIHPIYIKEISEKEKDRWIDKVIENKDKIVGIGEIGLDYYWIKEKEWQERQKGLFKELINLAVKLKKPIVIHAREAYEDVIKILEDHVPHYPVDLHMFGENKLAFHVLENGWFISMNTIVLRSKKHKKVVRDIPLEKLMLETDSPWLGFGKRNTPLSIKQVAEKIAEVKKLGFEEVWRKCGENAIEFFRLPLNI